MVFTRRLYADGHLRTAFSQQTDDSRHNGQIFEKGLHIFEEVADDRRNKLVRFTQKGREYAEAIIPPAAEAENIAMAQLGLGKLAELISLTASLTENMERQFSLIEEGK